MDELRSQTNLKKLKELSTELTSVESFRIMLDPQKKCSPEGVVVDFINYLEASKNDQRILIKETCYP